MAIGTPVGDDAPVAGGRWRALRADIGPLRRSRQLRLLLTGQTVSMAGSMLAAVALPYQAYELSHSSLIVGLLGLAEVIPYLVVGLVGGAVADAVDRRRLVLGTEAALAVCSGLLGVDAGLSRPQLWALFVVAFLAATFGALQRPSLDALLPRVVDPGDIPAATALSSLGSTVGQVAGPAAAGVLIAVLGLRAVYGIDVATFVVSLVAVGRMTAVPPPPDAARPSVARIAEGLRYARSRQELLGSYAVDMAAMFFGMPEALFPQLAARLGGPTVLGLLFTAPAVGSLLVSVTAGWTHRVRHKGRGIVVAAGSWGVAITGLGLARTVWPALAALVVAGGLDMVSGLLRSTMWNESIPDALRGRLAGIELVSFTSGPALGNVEGGIVESLGGLRLAIVSGGAACVAVTVLLAVALPGLWRYDPGPDPAHPSGAA